METIQIFINTPFLTNTLTITRTEIVTGQIETVGYLTLNHVHDPILILSLFTLFLFVGAGVGKPTLFMLSFFGLVFIGVLPQSGAWVAFVLIILLAVSAFYHWLTMGGQTYS